MPDPAGMRLGQTRDQAHPDCIFCGTQGPGPLALEFAEDGTGGVAAAFACPSAVEGYPGLVHGGVAAGLLDAAMTNALFAHGVAAVTGRLTIRYQHPLRLGRVATVTAKAAERRGAWWIVYGEIRQDGTVAALAEAWFKDRTTAEEGAT